MGFFSVDGGLYKFFTTLWSLIKINFLWLVFSIPIVTLGGATIAAFDVTMKMSDEHEGYVSHQFVRSFKKNFKNGIPFGIIMLVCIYLIWLTFSLFNQLEDSPIALLIAGMVMLFVFLLAFIYAYPLQARYYNTTFRTLKTSVDISVRYFLRTLLLIFVCFLELVVIMWNNLTMTIGLIIGPVCIMYTISAFAVRFFREIERDQPGSVQRAEEPEADEDEETAETADEVEESGGEDA
ncbi:MAG: DUF624 domain-containing protein [Clostridiales bacterium]|nr:DUF624 domain-containing protein [Clostridiales bacterium]